jgi:MoaA/NifB/PqqE/SkfB family radical SAM enzyme
MCPTQLNPLRKKLMTDELFEKIVVEAASFPEPVECFYIGVHGEPLVDKKLEDKVALCRRLGVTRTLISTNGSLLDQDRAASLLQAGPWVVVVSLESMKPEVYEPIRTGLSHAKVVANLKNFIRLRNEMGSPTRVAIRFIVSEWNESEKDDFVAYWSPMLDLTGRFDYIETDPIHNWGYGDPTGSYGDSPCPHIEMMTIMSDGVVSACCLDHEAVHHFGNVNLSSLVDIFNGPLASEFRSIHEARERGSLAMCGTCNVGEFWVDRFATDQIRRDTKFVAAEQMVMATNHAGRAVRPDTLVAGDSRRS